MSGPAFNWNNYPAEGSGSASGSGSPGKFSWNQYPSEDPGLDDGPGAGQSALEHFGNAATLGYLPQIQAAVSQMLPDPDADTDAKLRAEGVTINEPNSSYVSDRDANIARLAQESASHPYASGAGTVGGAIAGGTALSPLMPIDGATLAAKAGQAAGVGALYGALSNPGDTEGTISPIQPGARLQNAAIGAATGGVIQPAAEGIAGMAGWAKDQISDYAADKAAKAIGMTKADYVRLGPDNARAIGRAALQQGIVTPLATPASVAATTDTMKDAAGQNISQLIDRSQAQLDQMPPVGMMRVGPDIEATPVQPGTRLTSQGSQTLYPTADPYASAIDVPISSVDPTIERAGPTQPFVTPIQPRPAGSIDAPALAKQIISSGDLDELSKTPGMEGTASQVSGYLETLAKNPQDMNLAQAQALRQRIDRAIKWTRAVPEMAAAQQHLVDIRNALSDAVNQSVDQAAGQAGGVLGQLKQANSNYSTLAKINDISSNRAAMNAANRAVGLTDTIAAGAGGTIGAGIGGAIAGPIGAEVGAGAGAAIGGGVNKFARTYGPSLAATSANRLASVAGSASQLGSVAASNPVAAQALIQNGTRMVTTGPSAWMQQGIQKLGIKDPGITAKLLADSKGQQLLIQASDLTPGSQAMKQVMSQIQKGWGQ